MFGQPLMAAFIAQLRHVNPSEHGTSSRRRFPRGYGKGVSYALVWAAIEAATKRRSTPASAASPALLSSLVRFV